MLDDATVEQLYAAKNAKRTKQGKGYVILRGGEKQIIEKMGDFEFGAFVGKVGSIRRSRKGASRRLPNGRRKYDAPWDGKLDVVSYKLKSR